MIEESVFGGSLAAPSSESPGVEGRDWVTGDSDRLPGVEGRSHASGVEVVEVDDLGKRPIVDDVDDIVSFERSVVELGVLVVWGDGVRLAEV